MIILDLICWSLFLYFLYFVVYRFVIIINSAGGKFADIEKRDYQTDIERKLTVIIYSHNNSIKVKKLCESFTRQSYSSELYNLNVLLDNCNPDNIKFLEILGGARLWRINTDVKPIGKYKAIAWLLERIRAFENTNAFVFIDAECVIKSDFLEKVNHALHEDAIIAGETIKRKKFFINKVLNLRNKILTRVIRHGRYYTNLGNILDTDVLVIKQDILEKIEFKSADYRFEEFEYPLKLKYFNIPVIYSNEIVVNKNSIETLKSLAVKDYQKRYRSLRTFFNNFKILFSKNKLSVKEMVLSLTYPSGPMFIFWNLILINYSVVHPGTFFSSIITPKIIIFLFIAKIISDIHALISMRCNFNDYQIAFLTFFIEPVILLKSLLIGLYFPKEEKEKESKVLYPGTTNFEKSLITAAVTNGKTEYPCQLEIFKGDENVRVSFIFKGKKLQSSKQPRVSYALEEIVNKLKNFGFSLKICSNCGYFHLTESTLAHTDGEQGYCLLKNFRESSKEKEYKSVWDSCDKIIPSQARNYILKQVGLLKNPVKK